MRPALTIMSGKSQISSSEILVLLERAEKELSDGV